MGVGRAAAAVIVAGFAGSGCVLALEDRYTVEEPVDRIVVVLGSGRVAVEGRAGGAIDVEVTLSGPGSTGEVGHEVRGDTLYLDYDCGAVDLCGGELIVAAPSRVAVEVALGAGDLEIDAVRGDVHADLGAGSVSAVGLGSGEVTVTTGTGDVSLAFDERPAAVTAVVSVGEIDLAVPAGPYALSLDATAGAITVEGVDDDPAADATLAATTGAGSIRVTGR